MKTNITPTVGRKVWFWPNGAIIPAPLQPQPYQITTAQPLDATIVCVHSDRKVNLSVIDHIGEQYSLQSVTLRQDGDDVPIGHYAEWMPYQINQKAERDSLDLFDAATDEFDEDDAEADGEDDGTKVTLDGILDKIIGVTYTLMPDGRTTVCQLTLENGYTVNGTSACVDIDNYDKALGESYAYEKALEAVWPLEGYLLAEKLHNEDSEIPFPIRIAKVCHEANRAYCQAMGDMSQPTWEAAAIWQIASAISGVLFHLEADHSPEASHEAWAFEKIKAGWVHGAVKDPVAKTHPCLVPFSQLPTEQKAKDFIFSAIVNAMKPDEVSIPDFVRARLEDEEAAI